ncbi:hypothetical protein RO3G_00625 [Rhizopus delemar RA 99-880]|uniref:Uncharacterized protein n=1 Tax=Rhizopus delemar (strain RA 99-880 / ATCC MYA-4621 / FGSC 9543 / NRRL 43880) TaxID=246409 RepID=I1BI91_RHIO9|nr:hypothetical protein RO3G_00625 [Rhizopus delemar RA 99-880]|eukprot:EIE75921.1 hypothetical protein RO3G_00625 [Rhizopus delemar RA 99-880]
MSYEHRVKESHSTIFRAFYDAHYFLCFSK